MGIMWREGSPLGSPVKGAQPFLVDENAVRRRLDQGLRRTYRDAVLASLAHPALALFLVRAGLSERRAARTRRSWKARGVEVPAFMIVSVTNRCNLHCRGCYAHAQHRSVEGEMDTAKLEGLIAEARDLGISVILIAGGEPFVRKDLLDVLGRFPTTIFPVFTNGLLLDDSVAARLARSRNIIPILSLEGHMGDTDARRGDGVYRRLLDAARRLRKRHIFFGVSLTLTRKNYSTVTDRRFVAELQETGARVYFFVDFVPVESGTEGLVLTPEQAAQTPHLMESFRSSFPGIFIAFPGDEEASGGCLAAGRGFVHISSEGAVEPCPFSPFSDSSLHHLTLREALGSDLLRRIRASHAELTRTKGGCALWERREWVESLLAGSPQAHFPPARQPVATGRPLANAPEEGQPNPQIS